MCSLSLDIFNAGPLSVVLFGVIIELDVNEEDIGWLAFGGVLLSKLTA